LARPLLGIELSPIVTMFWPAENRDKAMASGPFGAICPIVMMFWR